MIKHMPTATAAMCAASLLIANISNSSKSSWKNQKLDPLFTCQGIP
jgi:hypothetical protein